MRQISFETQEYIIDGIRKPHPLRIIVTAEQHFIIECPYFDEYGEGDTFEEAQADLATSLRDLKDVLRKHQWRLSDEDKKILERLKSEII